MEKTEYTIEINLQDVHSGVAKETAGEFKYRLSSSASSSSIAVDLANFDKPERSQSSLELFYSSGTVGS